MNHQAEISELILSKTFYKANHTHNELEWHQKCLLTTFQPNYPSPLPTDWPRTFATLWQQEMVVLICGFLLYSAFLKQKQLLLYISMHSKVPRIFLIMKFRRKLLISDDILLSRLIPIHRVALITSIFTKVHR